MKIVLTSYPLPGTQFFEKVKDELKEKANWTDSDELKLMFKNTYPSAFYKQLHQYVHKNYRKHIAINNIKKIFTDPASITLKNIKKAASFAYYLPSTFFARKKLEAIKY